MHLWCEAFYVNDLISCACFRNNRLSREYKTTDPIEDITWAIATDTSTIRVPIQISYPLSDN